MAALFCFVSSCLIKLSFHFIWIFSTIDDILNVNPVFISVKDLVLKYMTLPEGFQNKSFYSCCDLVNFSPFAKWILSADDSSDRTRTNFVALIIHLAFNLYNLDPESHIKALVNSYRLKPLFELYSS